MSDVIVLPIERSCKCFEGGKKIPLRIVVPTMLSMRDLLNGKCGEIAVDTFLTYRCPECHEVVNVRVQDLYLA